VSTSFFCLLEKILDYLFPIYCIGCGKLDFWICDKCLQKVELKRMQCCPYCYQKSLLGQTCEKCLKSGAVVDGLLTMADYDPQGVLIKGLFLLKYQGFRKAAERLAALVEEFLLLNGVEEVQPMPISAKKRRVRGFNQTELLCGKVKKLDLVLRVKQKKAQMKLNYQQRRLNILGNFKIKDGAKIPETVWIFDDVATTLSTIEEVARTLKKFGAKKVFGATLARQTISG
jgi:competence protein ComFC